MTKDAKSGGDDVLSGEVLDRALAAKRRKIIHLKAELDREEHEAGLLEELMRLRSQNSNEDQESAAQLFSFSIAGGADVSPSRHAVVDEVAQILGDEGHPLHINDIMKVLTDLAVPLPGKGDQANVIAHMRRDPRFVRPSRGVYALKEWGLEDHGHGGSTVRRRRVVQQPRGVNQ
jgi:hypothetical protein